MLFYFVDWKRLLLVIISVGGGSLSKTLPILLINQESNIVNYRYILMIIGIYKLWLPCDRCIIFLQLILAYWLKAKTYLVLVFLFIFSTLFCENRYRIIAILAEQCRYVFEDLIKICTYYKKNKLCCSNNKKRRVFLCHIREPPSEFWFYYNFSE